jgi:photosystem II stability/assembly factor-like uncharacterized protein
MNSQRTTTWRHALTPTLLAAALGLAATLTSAQPEAASAPALQSARVVAHASTAELLGAARAGQRLVAVGDHGVILLSEDQGKSWQQARQVPVDGLLTGVSFVDEQRGWAVGHAGVILHTQDGGKTWDLQRSDTGTDRPLYAVHFFDAMHGVAVGLWSLVLVTEDGGKTWAAQTLRPPEGGKKADVNLLGLFANTKGDLFAPAERGMVLRSSDRGKTWSYLKTGYQGSFWTGLAMSDDTLLVAGLRGSLYRSADDGKTWSRIDTHSKSSITALGAREGDRSEVFGVGLDGLLLHSTDNGQSFVAAIRDDRMALTGLALLPAGKRVLLSRAGALLP